MDPRIIVLNKKENKIPIKITNMKKTSNILKNIVVTVVTKPRNKYLKLKPLERSNYISL